MTVTVEIDGEPNVRGRQKLRLADLAGPAAAQFGGRQVAAIDDPQSIEQLAGEEYSLQAAIVCQRRERANDRILAAGVGAVVRLQSPDRDDHGARSPEALLDAVEERTMTLHRGSAAID